MMAAFAWTLQPGIVRGDDLEGVAGCESISKRDSQATDYQGRSPR